MADLLEKRDPLEIVKGAEHQAAKKQDAAAKHGRESVYPCSGEAPKLFEGPGVLCVCADRPQVVSLLCW